MYYIHIYDGVQHMVCVCMTLRRYKYVKSVGSGPGTLSDMQISPYKTCGYTKVCCLMKTHSCMLMLL